MCIDQQVLLHNNCLLHQWKSSWFMDTNKHGVELHWSHGWNLKSSVLWNDEAALLAYQQSVVFTASILNHNNTLSQVQSVIAITVLAGRKAPKLMTLVCVKIHCVFCFFPKAVYTLWDLCFSTIVILVCSSQQTFAWKKSSLVSFECYNGIMVM